MFKEVTVLVDSDRRIVAMSGDIDGVFDLDASVMSGTCLDQWLHCHSADALRFLTSGKIKLRRGDGTYLDARFWSPNAESDPVSSVHIAVD